jgi:hypothetical protein
MEFFSDSPAILRKNYKIAHGQNRIALANAQSSGMCKQNKKILIGVKQQILDSAELTQLVSCLVLFSADFLPIKELF